MALLTPLKPGGRAPSRPSPLQREGLNKRGSLEPKDPRGPKRATLVALVLACATLATLDHTPALRPAHDLAGEIFGPVESAVSTLARPITSIPDWFATRDRLRDRISDLEQENAGMRRELRTTDYGRSKLAQYEGLTQTAEDLGYALVPARVTGYGPAQSFNRTVTIDAGSEAGITADMTVVNADGLVGRVLRVTPNTATVLLIVDADSVVGGRVGGGEHSGQVGMVRGTDVISHQGRLDLELVDQTVSPLKGETVVTWGDGRAAPYVSGVPIGRVTGVYASVRDSSRTVRIQPYVDFGSLDVVGVVAPSGTTGDRSVVEPDGSLK